MPRIVERWLLFKYIAGEFTPLSKSLKKKEQAEKARLKYPERKRKTITNPLDVAFSWCDGFDAARCS
jgi:hypothetical protein